jgi:peptidoglycan/xylan/chitin deacetylase (PgdA/CDA1 family)
MQTTLPTAPRPAAPSRRNTAAALSARTGVTWLIEQVVKPESLLVLNYHRIGDWWNTPHDEAVFSATADMFDDQVRYLKQRYSIVSLAEAVDLVTSKRKFAGTAVLLTFDDGYLDNHRLAFPILRAHGVPATFFLVTSLAGTAELPWWDQIAVAIKTTTKRSVQLPDVAGTVVSLDGRSRAAAQRQALDAFKSPTVTDPQRFLERLLDECEVTPAAAERLFLNWDEAREMRAAQMDFGSHTHSHRLLARLSLAEQVSELSLSRAILQRELQIPIDAVAYPVGSRTAYNAETFTAAQSAGYRAAFAFHGGINRPGEINPFSISRVAVEVTTSAPRFRMQCALAPHLHGYWF